MPEYVYGQHPPRASNCTEDAYVVPSAAWKRTSHAPALWRMTSTQSDPALQLVVQGEVADTVAIGLVGFIGSMIEAPPEGHGQSSGEQLAIATRIEETRSSLLRRVLAIFGAMSLVRPTILAFSGGRERERSDRRARPTATPG